MAAERVLLGRKVDVAGMDACLMTMIEVAYQLRDYARVLVGSEELEPGAGWPYARILDDLAGKPTIGPEGLGATIVRHYIESYEGTGLDATQSAIDLDQLGDLEEAMDVPSRWRYSRGSAALAWSLRSAWPGTARCASSMTFT